jgi:hypothetical protein
MTKKTYNLDLRGYDIKDYLLNPIVVWSFDFTELPVGRATISTDKLSVEVEFADDPSHYFAKEVAEMDLECLPAYLEDEKAKELIALSVSPKKS